MVGDVEMSPVSLQDGEELTCIDKLSTKNVTIGINVEVDAVGQLNGFRDVT